MDKDVDEILQQLKQTKDKELRLRAQKVLIRKELDQLQSGGQLVGTLCISLLKLC